MGKTDSTGTYAYLCDGASPGAPVLSDGHALYTPGLSENRGGVSSYAAHDVLGNLWFLDNGAGAQTYYQDTNAFGSGQGMGLGGTTASPFKFGGANGCLTDADTGLKLLGHRYYDSRLGRFITQDPAGSGDNWYAYADNDPVNKTDASGLTPMDGPGSSPVGSPGYMGVGGGGSGDEDDSESYEHNQQVDQNIRDHMMLMSGPKIAQSVPDSSVTTPAGAADVESMGDGMTVGKQGNPLNPMKDAARAALKKLHATEEQFASANRAISRATSSSKIAIKRDMENIIVNVTRKGRDGYQVFENVIERNGNKQVIQKAYNELGQLVHFHPK